MERREQVRNGLTLYLCCVLVFACVVMLGSQLAVLPRFVDVLIRPAVRILLAFSESPAVLKLFELFPHFASKGLPFLYAVVLFSPLLGYAFSVKRTWLAVQIGVALLHLAVYFFSL